MIEYIKSLIRANSLNSSKSFVMLVCAALGLILGLVLAFCLIWDVITNGYIKTEGDTIWWMLIGISAIITGGSIAKIASERKINHTIKKDENDKN